MFSKLCKSNKNSAWNLELELSMERFLYLSHPLYGICLKIFIMNRTGIFQRATQRARILFTDNIQSGGRCSVTVVSKLTHAIPRKVEIMKKSLYVERYIPRIPFLYNFLFVSFDRYSLHFVSWKMQETCRYVLQCNLK